MSHIFISYSTKNGDYAHKLANKLREEGFDVWIDKRRLHSSEDWWRSIVLALRGASACVVVLSPEADSSRWVQREITLAEKYEKPLFPLLLEGDLNTPNWELFVRTQVENVTGGELPPPEFYDYLEQHAPRRKRPGADVTAEPVAPPVLDSEIQVEIAHPPPPEIMETPAEPMPPVELVYELQDTENTSIETDVSESADEDLPVQAELAGASLETTDVPDISQGVVIPEPDAESPPIQPDGIPEVQQVSATPQPNVVNVTIKPAGLSTERTVTPDDSADASKPRRRFRVRLVPALIIVAIVTGIGAMVLSSRSNSEAAIANLTKTAAAATPTITPTPTGGGYGQIAYVFGPRGNSDIYLTNVESMKSYSMTGKSYPNNTNYYSPSWSPDGSQIAFISTMDNKSGIFVMNADRSNVRRLTDNSDDDDPTWSPDGNLIAFTSRRDDQYGIYVMNTDGSNIRFLTENLRFPGSPTWSPDSKHIAFTDQPDDTLEIYVMDADGSNVRRLTDNSITETHPVWSPDGSQIAYVVGAGIGSTGKTEIYVMDADGSNVRRLTDNSNPDNDPAWSPDGSQIAFASSRGDRYTEIYVMNADGSNVNRITTSSAICSLPAWRPA